MNGSGFGLEKTTSALESVEPFEAAQDQLAVVLSCTQKFEIVTPLFKLNVFTVTSFEGSYVQFPGFASGAYASPDGGGWQSPEEPIGGYESAKKMKEPVVPAEKWRP